MTFCSSESMMVTKLSPEGRSPGSGDGACGPSVRWNLPGGHNERASVIKGTYIATVLTSGF